MISRFGRYDIVREKWMTSRSENSSHRKTAAVMPLAMAVPIAAPRVPNAGIGPSPRISTTLSRMFIAVMAMPRRIGVLASPAARRAPPNMKNSSIPMLKTNRMRMYGSASTCTSGAALINVSRVGASQ